MDSGKQYIVLDAFEGFDGKRWVASIRKGDYIKLEYWYCELFGIDTHEKYEVGVTSFEDAIVWVMRQKQALGGYR